MLKLGVFTLLIATTAGASPAIAPYKDALFANPRVIESSGDFARYDYQEMRDINGRDEIPVAKVQAAYTESLAPGSERRIIAGQTELYEAGNAASARFVVIFIHGGGGNGSLGFSDITFGGNFNRLKHLAIENGGVYQSPSLQSFDDTTQLESLLERTPGSAPVILACGSMGGLMCWSAYTNPALAKRLAGVVLLGGYPHRFDKREAGVREKVKVYLAHGTLDPVYDVRTIAEEYTWLQRQRLPSKLAVYETGKHGTPIRMIDWREVLNWMLE